MSDFQRSGGVAGRLLIVSVAVIVSLEERIDAALRGGDRIGLCLPVLCGYRAGIRLRRRYQRNPSRLNAALRFLRLWPIDEETAAEFADLFRELRAVGRVMSQFGLLIATVARQRGSSS